MLFHLTPRPLLQLITAILLAPRPTVLASPAPAPSLHAGFSFNELFARYDCSGTYCGFSSQLCCTGVNASGGYWQYYTVTTSETDTVMTTEVYSSYIAAATTTAVAVTTATASCNYALNESQCGSICCASNQYCYVSGQCTANANGDSSGYYSTYTTPAATASAAIRGTSSALTVATVTSSPTTTIPFETPVATGANITLTSDNSSGGGGLSGGAIAGIVIGVLLGLFLLGLLCFYCCIKGLLDGVVALFGGGRRKRRVTEVEEYERHSHHASGGGGAAGRTWYGASRPARVSRYEDRRTERRSNTGKEALGIAGGLAALWAVLGLKRKREQRRNDEKRTEYSEYSSDYYTSASSASSDDRRTRDTRRSISRR
ncbi:hypothetical protein LTR36_005360 [Oleoguttula mirabilis]|uniref:Uncharacterized protein n=1 Tax=Oleoguttula mirabilis TaxID=1507867 RepID=A0AAV9JFA1_9PEZI|nr:hypothetical protein LTR36_005360 [Oleoguttula mirabilis]